MPDAAIADLLARVTVLEAQAQQLGRIPGQLGGLSGDVRDLKNAVGGLKDGLEAKVEVLEAALRDSKDGLKTKADETALRELQNSFEARFAGLDSMLRDPKDGLETKVDDLRSKVPARQNGKNVEKVSQLAGKMSRIEGQISMVMWLGPLVVAVIAVVVQVLS